MEHIEPAEVDGHRFAVLLVLEHQAEEEDEEGVVVHGTAAWDGAHLRFELPGGAGIDIPDAALEDLSTVSEDVEDLLGDAEYWINLPVGSSPSAVSPMALIVAGIPWPAPGR